MPGKILFGMEAVEEEARRVMARHAAQGHVLVASSSSSPSSPSRQNKQNNSNDDNDDNPIKKEAKRLMAAHFAKKGSSSVSNEKDKDDDDKNNNNDNNDDDDDDNPIRKEFKRLMAAHFAKKGSSSNEKDKDDDKDNNNNNDDDNDMKETKPRREKKSTKKKRNKVDAVAEKDNNNDNTASTFTDTKLDTAAAYDQAVRSFENDHETLAAILERPDAKEILVPKDETKRTLLHEASSHFWDFGDSTGCLTIIFDAIKKVGGKSFLREQLDVIDPRSKRTPLHSLCDNPCDKEADLPLFFQMMRDAGGDEYLKYHLCDRSKMALFALVESSFLEGEEGLEIYFNTVSQVASREEAIKVFNTRESGLGMTAFQFAVFEYGRPAVLQLFLESFATLDGGDDFGPVTQHQLNVRCSDSYNSDRHGDDCPPPILHLLCSNRFLGMSAEVIVNALQGQSHDEMICEDEDALYDEIGKEWDGEVLLWSLLNRAEEEDPSVLMFFAEIMEDADNLDVELEALSKSDRRRFHDLTDGVFKKKKSSRRGRGKRELMFVGDGY